ncbi:hypothetical protein D3C85_1868530 [compost metagenome]
MEGSQSACTYGGYAAFRNNICTLPVAATMQHDKKLSGAQSRSGAGRIAGRHRQAHPQHIDGRTEIAYRESGRFAHG